MPVPATCVPAGCARASGLVRMIMAAGLLRPAIETFSALAPLPTVMASPVLKPAIPPTGISVEPTLTAPSAAVPPGVPTVAMTAVSRSAPVPILIVCPAARPVTVAILILDVPASEAAARAVPGAVRKSRQLLSASWPSGMRPALVPAAGAVTRQPLSAGPETA